MLRKVSQVLMYIDSQVENNGKLQSVHSSMDNRCGALLANVINEPRLIGFPEAVIASQQYCSSLFPGDDLLVSGSSYSGLMFQWRTRL